MHSFAWRRNSASPSFMEIELTIALPWTHLRPASITSHFEESIIIGTRAISGSDATKFKKCDIALMASSIPSSMLMSIIWAPFSTCWRATWSASSNCSFKIMRANAFEPVTLVRSPTLTKSESSSITKGSRPESFVVFSTTGIWRGAMVFSASAIALICGGVVPQQPPAILMKPLSANSLTKAEVSAGFSSKPVSDIGLGNPAFG